MRVLLMLLVVGGLGLAVPEAQAQQGFLTCSSNGYRYNFCSANTQGRVVMVREISSGNLCRQGRGWGFDNSGIWVDRGCRADFSYGRDRGNWSWNGGDWDGPNRITCESISYRRNFCRVDTQNRVNLIREISTGNLCRQGSGWGFDGSGIWVDRGCRGEFSFGRSGGGGGGSSRDRNDAAIAAGVIGAFAVGAAIASSQNTAPPPPPPPPPPPRPPVTSPALPPAWAVGSYQGFDPLTGDIVTLVVDGVGHAYLRSENGDIVNEGNLRDGMIMWSSGRRSWLAREGPGVLLGDVDSGKHFYFRRNA